MPEITRYEVESQFPTEIDDLLCLSDVNLEQLPISNLHKEYLTDHRYTDAGALLEGADMDSLCASLFNLIESRLYTTQNHLNNKHTKWYEEYGVESPIETFAPPTDTTKKPVWTNIEDLSRIGTYALGSSRTLSTVGGFRP